MDASLPHHFPTRQLHDGTIFSTTPYPPHPTLAPHQDIGLDPFHFDPQLENEPQIQHPQQQRNLFDQTDFDVPRPHQPQPRFHEIRSNPSPENNGFNQQDGAMFGVLSRTRRPPNHELGQGQFGVLSPHPQLLSQHLNHDEQLGRLQHELDLRPVPVTDGGTTQGHFSNMKMVPNPPHLDEWRRRLFDVDDAITLTEDQYVVPQVPYFAHLFSRRRYLLEWRRLGKLELGPHTCPPLLVPKELG